MRSHKHNRKTDTLLGVCLIIFTFLLLAVPAKAAAVALTFDDGPTAKQTKAILEVLEEEQVPATFFLCGYRLEQFTDIAAMLSNPDHELGVHGYSHDVMNTLDEQTLWDELEQTGCLIETLTGRKPTLMRPPGGLCNSTVQRISARQGYPIILWSVDPQDWKPGNTAVAVCNVVVETVQDGDIILLHDLNKRTTEALPEMIRTLKQRGFEFLTVSQLAERQGIQLEAGVCYQRLPSNSG